MSIDLSKLSPAPWDAVQVYGKPDRAIVVCPHEAYRHVSVFGSGDDKGACADASEADADFIALARNAEDVQMRRGWHARKVGDKWVVDLWRHEGIVPKMWDGCTEDTHPFVALLKADRWYKEHVEKVPV